MKELFPLNISDLIESKSVESLRIEYKSSFTEANKWSTIDTISAFANDLQNQNGGYVIIGIDASDGNPTLPPNGIDPKRLEIIQRNIRVACKKIDPEYQPVLYPLKFQEKHILVIWAPAGDARPYKAPDDRNPKVSCLHVRCGAETVKATGELERQLLEQTARIPFDDRRSLSGNVLDISPILVKRFLQEINSDILKIQPIPQDIDNYRALKIVCEFQQTISPKNIGLLFFNERPEKFFSGSFFEIVQFSDDVGGNFTEERKFFGPLDNQILAVIDYLDSLTNVQFRKIPGKAQTERTVAYPYEALEEAIVNAAYHRSYETPEPNKIYLYPNRLEIISYPGPVAGISLEDLQATSLVPPVPARNRRIGEFLKELRLAEMRGTGIPKIRRAMEENGSAEPVVAFDTERTYFRLTLPAHPRYQSLHALREGAYLWTIGEKISALALLKSIFDKQPGAGGVTAQLIEFYAQLNNTPEAERVFQIFHGTVLKYEVIQPYLKFSKLLFENGKRDQSKTIINMLPESEYENAPLEVSIAYKRLKIFDKTHTILAKYYPRYNNNADYIHAYAKTKISIASDLGHRRNPPWQTIHRIRLEAVDLLRRAITLAQNDVEKAWCCFDLARTLSWLRVPSKQTQDAFDNALALLPHEKIFSDAYEQWRKHGSRNFGPES